MPYLMNEDQFWKVIDIGLDARKGKEQSFNNGIDEQEEAIIEALLKLETDEIVQFSQRLSFFVDKLYRYDIWGAAFLANGGCSDDSFLDFRYELVCEGKQLFNKVLENPDNLGDHNRLVFGAEVMNYVANKAYEKKTGKEILDHPGYFDAVPDSETEDEFDDNHPNEDFVFEDDDLMRRKYPKIWKRVESDWNWNS